MTCLIFMYVYLKYVYLKTLDCLICAQNWFKSPEESMHLLDMLLEWENYEEFAEGIL